MVNDAGKLKQAPSSLIDGLLEGFRKLQSRVKQGFNRAAGKPTVQRPVEPAHPLRSPALRLRGWAFVPTDVIDAKDRLVVRIEAPGLRREDIDVECYPRALKIRGVRHAPQNLTRDYQISAFAYGSFCRYVSLPAQVDVDHFAIKQRDGVLRIELMKQKAATKIASQGVG